MEKQRRIHQVIYYQTFYSSSETDFFMEGNILFRVFERTASSFEKSQHKFHTIRNLQVI